MFILPLPSLYGFPFLKVGSPLLLPKGRRVGEVERGKEGHFYIHIIQVYIYISYIIYIYLQISIHPSIYSRYMGTYPM